MSQQEIVLTDDDIIISETDQKGIITYVNSTFCHISGYTKDELLGANHNIVRHPDMPRCAFWWLWRDLPTKGFWRGNVKNLAKDGRYYWVDAAALRRVDPSTGNITYCSIRAALNRTTIDQMEELYAALRKIESVDGMEGGIRKLTELGVIN